MFAGVHTLAGYMLGCVASLQLNLTSAGSVNTMAKNLGKPIRRYMQIARRDKNVAQFDSPGPFGPTWAQCLQSQGKQSANTKLLNNKRFIVAKIPRQFADQPEMVNAIIEARRLQMEIEDEDHAIERLVELYPSMSLDSAARVLNDETFRYVALYPEGHPGLKALMAETRAENRRKYRLNKLRPQVIDRDDSRCQNCQRRVKGREATLDHKDPEGAETLENIHLLCRSCNSIKRKRPWAEFQAEQERFKEQVKKAQNERAHFICDRTGLSVTGRSWKEAGCVHPEICNPAKACCNDPFRLNERCKECGREIPFPDTVYSNGRCDQCKAAAVD